MRNWGARGGRGVRVRRDSRRYRQTCPGEAREPPDPTKGPGDEDTPTHEKKEGGLGGSTLTRLFGSEGFLVKTDRPKNKRKNKRRVSRRSLEPPQHE